MTTGGHEAARFFIPYPESAMDFQTTDLCDANEGKVRAVAPMFRSFGGKQR